MVTKMKKDISCSEALTVVHLNDIPLGPPPAFLLVWPTFFQAQAWECLQDIVGVQC